MVTCHECRSVLPDVDSLRQHLRLLHRTLLFAKYDCGENGCSRSFDSWRSYRKHLCSFHKCLSDSEVNLVYHSVQNEPENVVSNFTEDADMDDSNISSSDGPSVSLPDYKDSLVRSAEILVAKLYEKAIIPRNFVQTVLEDFTDFFAGEFLNVLHHKVMDLLAVPKPSEVSIQEISGMFEALKNPFENFSTDYKRMSHFESSSYYVAPVSYTISESRQKVFKTKNGPVVRDVKTTGQFVPLRSVLKNLFELPGALKDVLEFMESLKVCTGMYSNSCQCELWKKKTSKFKDTDIVVPVNFYYDEVECNAALGAHSEKLGAGYIMIPVLPPSCQSKLENILLALLIDGDDRKSDEACRISYNKEVFQPLVNELNYLECKGIQVQTDIGEYTMYFVLNTVDGDNLGVHGINGFAEGFTCNYPCTICRAPKEVTTQMVVEDVNLFRNVPNYYADVLTNNVTETGIKEGCVFNSVRSFHVVDNKCLDVMHDWAEGVSHYVLIPILKHFVDFHYFTMDKLNSRMAMFDYGPADSSNKPSCIRDDFHTKSKLKFTASEMYTFIRLFALFVGDLVPAEDQFWKLYKMHKDITEILQARSLPSDLKPELDLLIKEHHQLYIELTENHLTPKFHNMVHYGTIFNNSGPFCHYSSMRGESKHRFIRNYANSITSRKNLPKSCAIKHQLGQVYRFVMKSPLSPPLLCGPSELIDIEDHYYYFAFCKSLPSALKDNASIVAAKWVDFKGTRYEQRMVMIFGVDDNGYQFGRIIDIFILDEKPLFVLNQLTNIGLSDQFGGYEVIPSKSYTCVLQEDLVDPFPLYDFPSSEGENYVVLRHYV